MERPLVTHVSVKTPCPVFVSYRGNPFVHVFLSGVCLTPHPWRPGRVDDPDLYWRFSISAWSYNYRSSPSSSSTKVLTTEGQRGSPL